MASPRMAALGIQRRWSRSPPRRVFGLPSALPEEQESRLRSLCAVMLDRAWRWLCAVQRAEYRTTGQDAVRALQNFLRPRQAALQSTYLAPPFLQQPSSHAVGRELPVRRPWQRAQGIRDPQHQTTRAADSRERLAPRASLSRPSLQIVPSTRRAEALDRHVIRASRQRL